MSKQLVLGRKAKHLKRKRLAVAERLPVVAVDCSGSMGYTPTGSNEAKIDSARRALHTATSRTPSLRIVGFSGRGVDTFSRSTLYKLVASGGTPLMKCLLFCHKLQPKRLILITDGQPTDAGVIQILTWVAETNPPYPIDTVGTADADEDFLRAMSEHTGGEFKWIDDLSGLLEQHIVYLIEGGRR